MKSGLEDRVVAFHRRERKEEEERHVHLYCGGLGARAVMQDLAYEAHICVGRVQISVSSTPCPTLTPVRWIWQIE
jgi:hypothetical protein